MFLLLKKRNIAFIVTPSAVTLAFKITGKKNTASHENRTVLKTISFYATFFSLFGTKDGETSFQWATARLLGSPQAW